MGLRRGRLANQPSERSCNHAYQGLCLWNASVPQALHAKLGEAPDGRVVSGRNGQMSDILERGEFVLDQQDHTER